MNFTLLNIDFKNIFDIINYMKTIEILKVVYILIVAEDYYSCTCQKR